MKIELNNFKKLKHEQSARKNEFSETPQKRKKND